MAPQVRIAEDAMHKERGRSGPVLRVRYVPKWSGYMLMRVSHGDLDGKDDLDVVGSVLDDGPILKTDSKSIYKIPTDGLSICDV